MSESPLPLDVEPRFIFLSLTDFAFDFLSFSFSLSFLVEDLDFVVGDLDLEPAESSPCEDFGELSGFFEECLMAYQQGPKKRKYLIEDLELGGAGSGTIFKLGSWWKTDSGMLWSETGISSNAKPRIY